MEHGAGLRWDMNLKMGRGWECHQGVSGSHYMWLHIQQSMSQLFCCPAVHQAPQIRGRGASRVGSGVRGAPGIGKALNVLQGSGRNVKGQGSKSPQPGSQRLAVQGRAPRAPGFQVDVLCTPCASVSPGGERAGSPLLGQSCRKMGTCLLPL